MKDVDLKLAILDELDFEPRINASDVGITVDSGVVTLYGHVRSFTEKMAAENAVKRVRGVHAIADDIEVRLNGDPTQFDDDIARRAATILGWDLLVDSDDVEIRVQRGRIDLDGEVSYGFQRRRAEKLLGSIPGVRGVFNHLIVRQRAKETDIKSRIEEALHRQADRDASHVHIQVADGKVILTGQVGTLPEKDLVGETAWSAPGVRDVVNALRIGG